MEIEPRYSPDSNQEHLRALAALEKMKALEKEKIKQMKALRVDDKTLVYATPDRINDFKHKFGMI